MILIPLLILAVYWPTIYYTVIVDDIRWFKLIQEGLFKGQTPINWLRLRLYGGGTFTNNTKIEHAVTMAIHAAICSMIYFAFGSNQISFFAALLYAFNPINNQTSIWLNGRRYALNIVIVLTMILLGPLSFPLYFLTAILQPSAIFAPVVLFSHSPLFVLAIPALYLLIRRHIDEQIKSRMRIIHTDDMKKFTPKRIVVVVKCYGFYFFKMLFPGQTLMNYMFLHYWGSTKKGNADAYSINADFIKGIAALGVTLTAILLGPKEYVPYGVFMFLAMLQWCAILPANQVIADRYTSLPNVFVMLYLSHFINMYIPSPYNLAVITAFVFYYLSRLQITMLMYKNIMAFYDYHMYFSPECPNPRKFKVGYCMKIGDYLSGWHIVKDGLKYQPDDFDLLYEAGICLRAIGEVKEAHHMINKASQNYFIGQEEIQRNQIMQFIKESSQIDLSNEVDLIRQRKSKLPAEQRKRILDLWNKLNPDKVVII